MIEAFATVFAVLLLAMSGGLMFLLEIASIVLVTSGAIAFLYYFGAPLCTFLDRCFSGVANSGIDWDWVMRNGGTDVILMLGLIVAVLLFPGVRKELGIEGDGVKAWLACLFQIDGDAPRSAVGSARVDRFDNVPGFSPEDARSLVDNAKALVSRLKEAATRMAGRPEGAALSGVADKSEAIVATLDGNPALLPRAQHFLDVHLNGVADLGDRYAAIAASSDGPDAPDKFLAGLRRMDAMCDRQRKVLASMHGEEFDIRLEVFGRRLTADGA